MTPAPGKLLVASPAIADPNFYRTVILLLRYDDEGAFGLVLNRPLEDVAVDEHLPSWATNVSEPRVVFAGGPVEREVAFALGRCPENAELPGMVLPGVAVLDVSTDPAADVLDGVRIFSGYAGWGAGQLEEEMKDSGWFVVDPIPGDVFSPAPHQLWRDVLRRQKGELAMFAHFPPSPSHN